MWLISQLNATYVILSCSIVAALLSCLCSFNWVSVKGHVAGHGAISRFFKRIRLKNKYTLLAGVLSLTAALAAWRVSIDQTAEVAQLLYPLNDSIHGSVVFKIKAKQPALEELNRLYANRNTWIYPLDSNNLAHRPIALFMSGFENGLHGFVCTSLACIDVDRGAGPIDPELEPFQVGFQFSPIIRRAMVSHDPLRVVFLPSETWELVAWTTVDQYRLKLDSERLRFHPTGDQRLSSADMPGKTICLNILRDNSLHFVVDGVFFTRGDGRSLTTKEFKFYMRRRRNGETHYFCAELRDKWQ